MAGTGPRAGWKVSEVEQLVGLSRRDIQRACYGGRGGIGLVSPQDSSWGRRTYGRDDLTRLFVLGELKREGRSLPEAKRLFDEAASGETPGDGMSEQARASGDDSCARLLATQLERLRDQSENLLDRLLGAAALHLASGASADKGLSELVGWGVLICAGRVAPRGAEATRDALCRCAANLGACMANRLTADSEAARDAIAACTRHCGTADIRELLDELLASRGIRLAVELWLGPGTCAYIEQAWDVYESDMRKDARDENANNAQT
jgi:DNA-binding transcriptional MerR regulator